MLTMDRAAAQPVGPAVTAAPSHLDALSFARYAYRYVTNRALEVAGEEREYVTELAGSWDARLSNVITTAELMSIDELAVLDRLVSSAMHRDLSPAAVVEWVDAFPSAVLDLLGSSAIELDQEVDGWADTPAEEATEQKAANKHSTLALAA
jgi:hypothetical protein